MPDGTNNSIINLGDISKPADTLVRKISNLIGGIFKPYQITRVAKAQAEVALLNAETEIEITNLQRRAMRRFVEEEGRRQENIENITLLALPQLSESANPNVIEDDWISNFFDKSRIVSDHEMQGLWSRVLAGEANAPGSYSKRTVNFLSDLDANDAQMLSKLLQFGWNMGEINPLIFDVNDKIYEDNGLFFSSLIHLESIGLIQFNHVTGFVRKNLPHEFGVLYFEQSLMLKMSGPEDRLQVGNVMLTKVGQELARICKSQPVEGFVAYVSSKWLGHLL